jgi:hypothetical protein
MKNPAEINVLIACEESQAVCIEFRKLGFKAFSCDLQDCSGGHPEWHIKGDILKIMNAGWDLMIAHPPCTYLAVCNNNYFRANPVKWKARLEAIEFVWKLWNAENVARICIENPVGVISSYIRQADQYIQPWQFGHGETKKTGLWLQRLPKLTPTNIVEGREQRIWKMAPSDDRAKLRSKTYPGIAKAMAEQWGEYLLKD